MEGFTERWNLCVMKSGDVASSESKIIKGARGDLVFDYRLHISSEDSFELKKKNRIALKSHPQARCTPPVVHQHLNSSTSSVFAAAMRPNTSGMAIGATCCTASGYLIVNARSITMIGLRWKKRRRRDGEVDREHRKWRRFEVSSFGARRMPIPPQRRGISGI